MGRPNNDGTFRPLSTAEAEELECLLNQDAATGNTSLAITPASGMQVVNRNEVTDPSMLTTTAANMGTNYFS